VKGATAEAVTKCLALLELLLRSHFADVQVQFVRRSSNP